MPVSRYTIEAILRAMRCLQIINVERMPVILVGDNTALNISVTESVRDASATCSRARHDACSARSASIDRALGPGNRRPLSRLIFGHGLHICHRRRRGVHSTLPVQSQFAVEKAEPIVCWGI